ncbi:hypothetical protein HZA43_01330 [Candidatus Peregrinibacteria bacterium]|nr:hypothetical protein [Candidatus Peregrinibacteria bacterium]
MNQRIHSYGFIKKLFAMTLIVLAVFLLNRCGKSDSSSSTGGTLKTYEGNGFAISMISNWKIITPAEFYAEIPRETMVAFTSPEATNGFFTNVNILKEDLKQAVSPIDYARANINLSAQNLTNYEKIQEVRVQLGTEKSILHIFQARLNPAEKTIKFIQVYSTKGNFGYVVTGGMLPDAPQSLRDLVGSMVTSFRLK